MNRMAAILVTIAVLYILKDRIPFPLFKLPGDIEFNDGRWNVVFPITSCVLIGVVVSLVMHYLRIR